MFNQKTKSDISSEAPVQPSGASIIAAGTTVKGDISSTGDIRIDGTLQGNVQSTAKVVIGATGTGHMALSVEICIGFDLQFGRMDISGNSAAAFKLQQFLDFYGAIDLAHNVGLLT